MAQGIPTAPANPNAPLKIRAAAQVGQSCRILNEQEAARLLKSKGSVLWVDILVHDFEAAKAFLEDALGFHELAVEDALSDQERPTLQEFDDYIFFAAPALTQRNGNGGIVEVGFFLTRNAVVTVSSKHVDIIDDWFNRWYERPQIMSGSAAMIVHSLLDGMVDQYFPVVDAMEDELDDLSDRIFSGDTGRVKDILVLKKRLLEVRRRIAPVRDILNGLLRRDIQLIPLKAKPYFQDILDHVIRIGEIVDLNRETLASLLDVHLSLVSNNLNLVLKKMTVLATVLMVATLIAGIYGMNFVQMPELHWKYGYVFALGLMVLSAGGTLWIFRRMKWI